MSQGRPSMSDSMLRRIEAGQLNVAYFDHGLEGAPAAILLHGFPETSIMWEPLLTSAANAGFIFLRATNANDVVRLVMDAVSRGLIEFYLRWNNIVDQYGWSFVLSESRVRLGTSEFANDTSVGTLKRWRCMQQGGTCSTGAASAGGTRGAAWALARCRRRSVGHGGAGDA